MIKINTELYKETYTAFDKMHLLEKIRFINNMMDQMKKRGQVELKDEFLIDIPKEETHIIPIEYIQENHYSNIILNLPNKNLNNLKPPVTIFISGAVDQTPVETILHDKRCWIKQGELDEIIKFGIFDLHQIKVLAYVEGLLSPYLKINNISNAIDGYKIYLQVE